MACLAAGLLISGGCSGPDEEQRRAERERQMRLQLEEANQFLNTGAVDEAILLLEIARSEYPEQADVLEALGFAYLSANQHDLAADLFAESYRLDPARGGIAVFAARAFTESGETDAAVEHYAIYLGHYPGDAEAWRSKATLLLEQNRRRPALDALLEALRQSDAEPTAADCLQISSLFLALGNPSQAASWLDRAEDLPLDHSARAELKLQQFELALRNQQWQQAADIMNTLDADYPSEFEASPHYANRAPLEKWIADQIRVRDLRIAPAPTTDPTPPDTGESPLPIPPAGQEITVAASETEATEPTADTTAITSADTPAPAPETIVTLETEAESIPFDKVPAEGTEIPDFAIVEADEPLPPAVETPTARPGLIGEADLARDAGNYERALGLYMRAIGQNDRDATPWLEISRIYRIRGLNNDAELTALEAIRRAPRDPEMTLNYLEILQDAASPSRQIQELNAARARFPNDPDITFTVAQGLERLDTSPRNALFLYREFLATAPADHPKRDDAQNALQRLR